MNILFCHDGPINFNAEKGYYSIGFNDKLFSRYESVFGKVSFVTRVDRVDDAKKYREADKLSADRFRVIKYPNYLNLRGVFSNKTQSNKMLEKEIEACDALIIRLPSFLGSLCVRLAKKHGKPYLVELVGCPWDSLRNHGASGKILAPYMRALTKRQVKHAPFVLYVTDRFLQSRYPTDGKQIGCSDVELSVPSQKREKKPEGNKLVFGTAAKIDLKYKGHKTVILAMRRLTELGYDVHYQIAGPGDRTYLEEVAAENGMSDRVTFTGALSHEEIFEWLNGIDVYIQPSFQEGMPRALIEAMSRGCPCVASDAGGMTELLKKPYLFERGNEKELADIVINGKENGLFAQGERNAEFAKRFYPETAEKKREAFFREFFDYVTRQRKDE